MLTVKGTIIGIINKYFQTFPNLDDKLKMSSAPIIAIIITAISEIRV
jgi:hypothetical protein